MINFSKALDKTLNYFDLTGKWLSEQSGVSQQMISCFRKGNQRVYSDSLERMIAALPPEPRNYFFAELSGAAVQIEGLVDQMDDNEIAELLLALSKKFKSRSEIEMRGMASLLKEGCL